MTATVDRLGRGRLRLLRSLPSFANVLTAVTVRDDRGRPVTNWAGAPQAVPAWVPAELWPRDGRLPARVSAPTRADLELAGDRFGMRPSWVVTVPYGTAPEVGARLDLDNGRQVQVVGVYTDAADYRLADRLATTEVPRG